MNIAPLLRQTVQWQPCTSTDDRTDRTYGDAQTLQARSVGKIKDLIGKDGEVVTATNAVTLLQSVTVGDLIDGREVVGVNELVDVGGNTSGYQALTR